jgi:hypothetical protein
MSPKTETLEMSSIYSKYDFPEIGFGNREIYVNWRSYGQNDLSEPLEDGIQISKDDYESLELEFRELCEKYGLSSTERRWVERENGMYSLIWLRTHIAYDYTNIWGDKEDYKQKSFSLSSQDKLHSGEFANTDEAIFLLECLSHYLKYSGIQFPYIKTNFLEIKEEPSFNDIVHKKRLYEYYFSIPFVEDIDYNRIVSLQTWLKDKNILISEDNISIDGEFVGCLIEKDGGKFWDVGNIYDSSMIVELFHVLGSPLKHKLFEKD